MQCGEPLLAEGNIGHKEKNQYLRAAKNQKRHFRSSFFEYKENLISSCSKLFYNIM